MFGRMNTNPLTGNVELLLVPRDGEGFDAADPPLVFSFPFKSRAEAFAAISQVFNEGIQPSTLALEELADSSSIDIQSTNIDDFILSNGEE